MDLFERFSGKPPRPDRNRVQVGVTKRRQSEIEELIRRNSRKRPPGMAPALVEPPRGPQPLSGGAAAPLEFGD